MVGPDSTSGAGVLGGMFSGAMLAFGVMLVVGALAGAIGLFFGVDAGVVEAEQAAQIGIGAALALIVVQFLAYLWGGYVGGRMAPGRGSLTGGLTAAAGLLIAVVLGVLTAAAPQTAGTETQVRASIQPLPYEFNELAGFGIAVAVGVLIAMFAGGFLGGALADRYYGGLAEDYTIAETYTRTDDADTVRDRDADGRTDDAEIRQTKDTRNTRDRETAGRADSNPRRR